MVLKRPSKVFYWTTRFVRNKKVRNKLYAKLILGGVRNGTLFLYFMSVIYPVKIDKSNPLEKKTLRALQWPIFGDLLGDIFAVGSLGDLFGTPLGSLLERGLIWEPSWGPIFEVVLRAFLEADLRVYIEANLRAFLRPFLGAFLRSSFMEFYIYIIH